MIVKYLRGSFDYLKKNWESGVWLTQRHLAKRLSVQINPSSGTDFRLRPSFADFQTAVFHNQVFPNLLNNRWEWKYFFLAFRKKWSFSFLHLLQTSFITSRLNVENLIKMKCEQFIAIFLFTSSTIASYFYAFLHTCIYANKKHIIGSSRPSTAFFITHFTCCIRTWF